MGALYHRGRNGNFDVGQIYGLKCRQYKNAKSINSGTDVDNGKFMFDRERRCTAVSLFVRLTTFSEIRNEYTRSLSLKLIMTVERKMSKEQCRQDNASTFQVQNGIGAVEMVQMSHVALSSQKSLL